MIFRIKIFIILIAAIASSSCNKHDAGSSDDKKDNDSKEIINKTDSTRVFYLSDKQKKILAGAKKCLGEKFKYDMSMAYHVLTYKDNVNTDSKVFPGGDLEPGLGVCTEVTIRSLRYAGIVDLQQAIHDDLASHRNDYPMSRWGAKKPDSNIDHRRVPNQLVWFRKYWQEIKGKNNGADFQPGDVVIWDMDGDSWGDHIGIVSDKFVEGVPYLIHNFPSPGYVAEENVLNRWNIIGHFRVRE
jgi:uncharacterized protein YijF (DUF1287 family)